MSTPPPATIRLESAVSEGLLGMVLAAGRGERMRPLSDVVPKPALPVAGRPLVHMAVENLQKVGVYEAHVNLWHLPERMAEALETIGGTGFNMLLHKEKELLGTAGGLYNAFGEQPEDDIVVHNGDVLYRGSLQSLVETHQERNALATLGLVRVGDRSVPRSVILAPGGYVDDFRQERIPPPDAWTFSGIYVLSGALFEKMPPRGCIVKEVFAKLLDTRRILGVPLQGVWSDLGAMGRYKAIHNRVLGDRDLLASIRPDLAKLPMRDGVIVHPRARIHESAVIRSPAIVDVGAELRGDTVVGPDVYVGAGSLVRKGTRLQKAVIFPGADVSGEMMDVFLIDDVAVAAYPPSM
jgi:NDP-sugar pyrophosphorylase family protein